jgi:hypothetical protein
LLLFARKRDTTSTDGASGSGGRAKVPQATNED